MGVSRRQILAVAVAGGLGGCLSSRDDSGDDGQDDVPPEELLTFGANVTEEHRERAVRALSRTQSILGERLDSPVHVEVEILDLSEIFEGISVSETLSVPETLSIPQNKPFSGNGMTSDRGGRTMESPFGDARLAGVGRRGTNASFDDLVDSATHREPFPDVGFQFHGRFWSDSRTIAIAVTEDIELATNLLRLYVPTDVPDDALESYPNDALFAHEFVHALQFDTVDDPPSGTGHTVDETVAGTSVMEGLAHYVTMYYRANCLDETYDECASLGFWYTAESTPSFAIGQRLPYLNGSILTYYLLESGGWDAVWDAHRNPPRQAWAAMFPKEYVENGGVEDRSGLDDMRPPIGWDIVGENRLGVNALYEKLYYLDVVSRTPEDGKLPGDVTETIMHEYMHRTDLLRGWRGDSFRGFERTRDGLLAYQWGIWMASVDDAVALATAIRSGYERRGVEGESGWKLDDSVVTVDRDGDRIMLWMAPDFHKLSKLRDMA